ncbi:3152_t:CDS:2, partial [Cetraspora pellucida]
ILSEHEGDLKIQVKDILHDRAFYEECWLIASILYPLKLSVGCLESRTSNLADCYVYLISLANTIFRLPNQNIKEWELQALALRLFAITPHSASCERSFSVLGWFYNQRRTNLAAERAEEMCKLHTFYITNVKQELPCYAIDMPENLLHNQLIDSVTAINNKIDEITNFLNTNNDNHDNLNTEIDINTSEVYTLNIMNSIDVGLQIFNMDRKANNEII